MYNLEKKPPGPIMDTSGIISTEGASIFHNFMKAMIGSDQSEIDLAPGGSTDAPWLAVSDKYAEFVRSGNITIQKGRFVETNNHTDGKLASVSVSADGKITTIEGVAAVILATGFDATSSVDFLEKEVLETLGYDPGNPFPLDLQMHSSTNENISSLGFVGFYRSPYWGVMEMQAKFLGRLWAGDKIATNALESFSSPIPARRKCFYESPERLAQFPMGDYTFLMEELSAAIGLKRLEDIPLKDSEKEPRTGIVLPARYAYEHQDKEEIHKAISSVKKAVTESAVGRFIARAVFKALQGRWNVSRRFTSRDVWNPSGNFEGTASFHPRDPTDDAYDLEYLYMEEGEFTTDKGLKFRANRRYAFENEILNHSDSCFRYVHRYQESTDTLSVWFVKPTNNKTVDYLFHEMEILPPVEGSGWRAKSYHWCQPDDYNVEYDFNFQGVGLREWVMAYTVKGPNKDYTISSTYRR
jgi:hypothetical protein